MAEVVVAVEVEVELLLLVELLPVLERSLIQQLLIE